MRIIQRRQKKNLNKLKKPTKFYPILKNGRLMISLVTLVLPKGWRGEWELHATTRKLYVMHHDAA